MAADQLKLYYFDFPGKAECIRLACAYSGLKFEDVRLTREQFMEMKTSGALPYGQVPALSVNGKILGQTSSIMRYIGKITGLYPTDPIKAALVDSILDEEADMFASIGVSKYQERFGFELLGGEDSEQTKTVRKSINDNVLPRHLAFLERLITEGGTDWFAGTPTPTIADFVLVPRLQWLADGAVAGIDAKCLDSYPKIKNLIATFSALPQVAEWNKKFNQ